MSLNLPIYKIVGPRPIKMTRTPDGGSLIEVWDFDAGEFVQGGAEEYDVLMGYGAPGGGEDALHGDVPKQGGLDERIVTEAEFEEYVATLR